MHCDGLDFGKPWREEEDSEGENTNDRHRGDGLENRSSEEKDMSRTKSHRLYKEKKES